MKIEGPATLTWQGGTIQAEGIAIGTIDVQPRERPFPREPGTIAVTFTLAPGARRLRRKLNAQRRKRWRLETARTWTRHERTTKQADRYWQSVHDKLKARGWVKYEQRMAYLLSLAS